jgi:hypothetical protein
MPVTPPFREDVLRDRLAWCDFLEDPARGKAYGMLAASPDSEDRCCLGHAMFMLLGPPIESEALAARHCQGLSVGWYVDGHFHTGLVSPGVVARLGMWTSSGAVDLDSTEGKGSLLPFGEFSLSALNDRTHVSPQEVGALLRSLVEGGRGTPFRPLDEFPTKEVDDAQVA